MDICHVQTNVNRQLQRDTHTTETELSVTVREARNCFVGASYVLPTVTTNINVKRGYR